MRKPARKVDLPNFIGDDLIRYQKKKMNRKIEPLYIRVVTLNRKDIVPTGLQ